jgi:hypothetical protein
MSLITGPSVWPSKGLPCSALAWSTNWPPLGAVAGVAIDTLQPIYGPRPRCKKEFVSMVDTVRINLYGLSVELLLPAIMGIRTRLSLLTRWPRGPWLQPGFRRVS